MPYKDPEARKAYHREYNAKHAAAMMRAYRATDHGYAMHRAGANRDSARNRGATIDPELTTAVLADVFLGHNECDWCRVSVPLRERMIDHRVGVHFGGAHTASNIQILCKPCETRKTIAENSLIKRTACGVIRSDFALVA